MNRDHGPIRLTPYTSAPKLRYSAQAARWAQEDNARRRKQDPMTIPTSDGLMATFLDACGIHSPGVTAVDIQLRAGRPAVMRVYVTLHDRATGVAVQKTERYEVTRLWDGDDES